MPSKIVHSSGLGISETRLCLDFVNTEGEVRNPPPERLAELGIFLEWAVDRGLCEAEEAAVLGELETRDPAAVTRFLERAREFREALYRVLIAGREGREPTAADLDLFDRELTPTLAHLRLGFDGGAARFSLPRPVMSLESLLEPIAASAADLLRSGQLSRIKECASETCSAMFIDESKNRSRRWCDMSNCGNRAKARRFYRRHRKPAS